MARVTGANSYGSAEVCRLIGISYRQLEYWVLIGVITPTIDQRGAKTFKRFTEDDLWILKQVKELTDEGFLVSRAVVKLKRNFPERFVHTE
ncbi:MAG: MerR family transcriptional regulator [Nitrospiria bacterium]